MTDNKDENIQTENIYPGEGCRFTISGTPVHFPLSLNNCDENIINSSWAEMELDVIGHYDILPLTLQAWDSPAEPRLLATAIKDESV